MEYLKKQLGYLLPEKVGLFKEFLSGYQRTVICKNLVVATVSPVQVLVKFSCL